MKADALDVRKRVVKFMHHGGTKAEAARRFDRGRPTVDRDWASAQTGTLAPKTSWGHGRKRDPHKLQAPVNQHPDATLQELQPVFGVSHPALWVRLRPLGCTLKKLTKYRERNAVQRWLFRRELENLAAPVDYLDECGVDHRLYREPGRAPRGARIEQEVAGQRRARTRLMAAAPQNKLGAPLGFQGGCPPAVVDVYFQEVLLPGLPAGSVIVLDNARFPPSPTTQPLVAAAGCQ